MLMIMTDWIETYLALGNHWQYRRDNIQSTFRFKHMKHCVTLHHSINLAELEMVVNSKEIKVHLCIITVRA